MKGKRMMKNVEVKEGYDWPIFTADVSKTILTLTGVSVKRNGQLMGPMPTDEAMSKEFFGADQWKWACHAWRQHMLISAANQLTIASSDPAGKKLVRQFRESLRTLTEVMGFKNDEALKTLLAKDRFAPLLALVEEAKTASKPVVFDFTVEKSQPKNPRWFDSDEDDSDTDEDDTEGQEDDNS